MDSQRVAATDAWARQVRTARAQIDRLRETTEEQDLYGPWAERFAGDPNQTDDPALEVLLSEAQQGDAWLDIGAGGGRYALPLSVVVRRVVAVEPSTSMLEVLRAAITEHGIDNIEVIEGTWPVPDPLAADVALMAHVGYDIEAFGGAFLDAAERAVARCVVIMRTSGAGRAHETLWPEIHGEPRLSYPMLREFLELLRARGVAPSVTYVDRGSWGYQSPGQMLEALRRLLYLRPGSAKDVRLEQLLTERASEHDGRWELDRTPMKDGVVAWEVTK